jgi:hypothetical protein
MEIKMEIPPPDPSNKNGPASNIFRTSDLYLSAYLRVRGISLIGTEGPRNRVVFLFEDKEEIQKFIADYYNNGLVGALDFKNYVRELKTLVHRGFPGARG